MTNDYRAILNLLSVEELALILSAVPTYRLPLWADNGRERIAKARLLIRLRFAMEHFEPRKAA